MRVPPQRATRSSPAAVETMKTGTSAIARPPPAVRLSMRGSSAPGVFTTRIAAGLRLATAAILPAKPARPDQPSPFDQRLLPLASIGSKRSRRAILPSREWPSAKLL